MMTDPGARVVRAAQTPEPPPAPPPPDTDGGCGCLPWVAIMVIWASVSAATVGMSAYLPPSALDGWGWIAVLVVAYVCAAVGTYAVARE